MDKIKSNIANLLIKRGEFLGEDILKALEDQDLVREIEELIR
jgi:hypothetical protein